MSKTNDRTLQYITEVGPADFSAHEIEILGRVNQKIAAAPNIEKTMDYLFEATKEICRCDRVSLAFVADDRQRLVCHYAKADYEPLLLNKGYSEDLQGSSLQNIIEAGRCRLIGDLKKHYKQHPNSRSTKILLEEGVRSSMTCPLKVEGRTIGLLFRSSKQPHTFSPHEVRIHLAITERLSQTIEKAYRIEQLAEANKAYMEILGFVTHELKSPVASVVMTANLLLDGTYGPLQPLQREKIQRMVFKGQYLLALVRDYLNLARMEGGQLEPNPQTDVDFMAQVVKPTIEMVQPWLAGKNMRLVKEFAGKAGGVECDPNLMIIAMTNLLNNAAKYGNRDGLIRCAVNCKPDRVEVSVWNEGPGFSEQDKDKLFRKFSRLDDPALRKAKGTGVGLYTVWRIINSHGGRISAGSEQGKWAEFTFHIPRPLPKPT